MPETVDSNFFDPYNTLDFPMPGTLYDTYIVIKTFLTDVILLYV
jgi:hypothetical protein